MNGATMLTPKDLYPPSFNPEKYAEKVGITKIFSIEINSLATKVHENNPLSAVDPNNIQPFPPKIEDLGRLHWLTCDRRVTTILEFGVGYSTDVFADAISRNKKAVDALFLNGIRRGNPFEVHSIDNNQNWVDICKQRVCKSEEKASVVRLHLAKLYMSTFNGRICTFYDPLPDLSPDLIYIDGPDQNSVNGTVRGISTRHGDRMPMSGDILAIEHFLQPGTLIVIDGRSANARFLRSNLQRNWSYLHIPEWDQHYFELQEPPLGRFNKMLIDKTLGESYYHRLEATL